jgi:dipeptidyl aminopeptidase/acylaminoacyl peptidase
MAGNVVTRSMAVKPDIPAVVVWAGAVYSYTDREKYGINDGSYVPPSDASERARKRKALFDAHGEFNPGSPFWKQIPVTNYLSDLKGAIQINHAIDDNVVDIGYSRDFTRLLDATHVPHEIHEYPSGGHNISGAAFDQAMQNTVGFFKKYLR